MNKLLLLLVLSGSIYGGDLFDGVDLDKMAKESAERVDKKLGVDKYLEEMNKLLKEINEEESNLQFGDLVEVDNGETFIISRGNSVNYIKLIPLTEYEEIKLFHNNLKELEIYLKDFKYKVRKN